MKREIRFRGLTITGEWVIGYFGITSKGKHYIDTIPKKVGVSYSSSHSFVDPRTVGQYIGLKDKNGKDIYEGDIIEFHIEEWGDEDNKFEVKWDNENYEYCLGGGSKSDMEFRAVIGNIHENPEIIRK